MKLKRNQKTAFASKLVSVVLSFVLVAGLLPASAFAAGAEQLSLQFATEQQAAGQVVSSPATNEATGEVASEEEVAAKAETTEETAEAEENSTKEVTTTDAASYVSDEILVVLDQDTSQDTALESLSTLDAANVEALATKAEEVNSVESVEETQQSTTQVVTVKLNDGEDPLEAAQVASTLQGVAYAQPNYVYTASSIYETEYKPNDPALASTTPSSSSSNANAWQLASIKAFEAWNMVRTNNTVTIAVLDTGCNVNHEDLKDQIWQEYAWNIDSNSKLTKDYSSAGHGTHVAGCAAAQANNGVGTAGSSYNARILPIGVFDSTGTKCYTSTLIKAYQYLLQYADELNIHVVNMSLGGYYELGTEDYALQELIATAKQKNIVTVCAGGNGDKSGNPKTEANYPADYSDCVSVTALATNGKKPTTWSDYNASKDICAPGQNIYSTYSGSTSSYTLKSGSSMAAPIVSGAFALLWAADADLTVSEATDLIYSTASELTVTSGREGQYGHGILNIYAALLKLAQVSIDSSGASVFSGTTQQMTASSTLDISSETLEWSVENETGSATINKDTGVLTGLMPGTVKVSVKFANSSDVKDTIEVKVKEMEVSAFAVGSSPYVAGYVLVTYAGDLPSGWVIDVAGIQMLKGSTGQAEAQDATSTVAYYALVPTSQASTLTSESFTFEEGSEQSIRTNYDVNNNGRVNIVDAQIIYDLGAGRYEGSSLLSMDDMLAADVNADATVDSCDAFALQGKLLTTTL